MWLVFRITLFPCLTRPIYTSDLEIFLFLLKARYWSFHGIFKIQLPILRKKKTFFLQRMCLLKQTNRKKLGDGSKLYLPRCHIESTLEPKNALGDYLDGFALEKIFA